MRISFGNSAPRSVSLSVLENALKRTSSVHGLSCVPVQIPPHQLRLPLTAPSSPSSSSASSANGSCSLGFLTTFTGSGENDEFVVGRQMFTRKKASKQSKK